MEWGLVLLLLAGVAVYVSAILRTPRPARRSDTTALASGLRDLRRVRESA